MSTVTADAAVQQWLAQLHEVTAIQDAQGNVLGVFTPPTKHEAFIIEKVKSQIDRVELERRKREEHGQGITTPELLKKLEAMESCK